MTPRYSQPSEAEARERVRGDGVVRWRGEMAWWDGVGDDVRKWRGEMAWRDGVVR